MKIISVILSILIISSCVETKTKVEPTKEQFELLIYAKKNFSPLRRSLIDITANHDLINLGKKLYKEEALSANGKISCNSCHALEHFGVDNEKTSPGHDGTRGERNSPTTYNAALHFRQFWDGRAKDVEEQALGPLLNPIEHGLKSDKEAISKIDTPLYRELFEKAFGNRMSFKFENIGKAIGAFERTLLTRSRFDDFLEGDYNALTAEESQGLRKFIDYGCVACHDGEIIGGNSYQMLGAVEDYPTKDLGRYEVTKDEDDKKMFKVPSLRNVAQTFPYLHDGSIATLDEVIVLMGRYQLGEKLNTQDVSDIKAFLGSLTGKGME